ncbi:MAG: DnaJ C-terminal domain-containing protein [Gammaproteobacteria bacterium]|nr:DnaJ C-terminal domain-containing protein [Gammaproteobacteria bacterium]
MEYKDYYKILGVERGASEDEIKKSYRRLARKYHPDVSKEPDAEKRFKELGEAYEVLKDAQKRQSYDQLGANWKAGQDFNPPPGWEQAGFGGFGNHGGSFDNASGFSDFFESMFGGGFGQSTGAGHHSFQQAGHDQTASINVSIRDAFNGANRTIRLAGGKSLQVKIPKGISSGKKIRLSGQGSPGINGGPNGDLYLEVSVVNDAEFEVEGKDVYVNVNIAPWEAALGEKVPVSTLDGQVEIKIPANSKSGRKMRLTGKGMPGRPAGDLYVRLNIVTPPASNDEEKDFYKQMKNKFSFNPRTP